MLVELILAALLTRNSYTNFDNISESPFNR